MSSAALAAAIASATAVRVTRPGEFDARRRGRRAPLFVDSDAASLTRLRRCLAVDDRAFAEEMSWMTPGVLDLNFTAGHELLATVSFLYPDALRWSGDGRLIEPGGLVEWLVEHGWVKP